MVGREAELAEVAAAVGLDGQRADGDRGAQPRTRRVLLSGDAGVGKTRLLLALRERAAAAGWQVLVGHCLDFGDSDLPYLPFSEVLGQVATGMPEVLEQTARVHPALARLQPGRRVVAPVAGDETQALDRAALFESAQALFEAAAETAPVLLVIEDLHWAEQSTRDLLSFLFTRPFAGPVAVVGSYRSDDLHRRHPLRRQVSEWARLRGVERIAVPPLGEDEVRALIATLAPHGLADQERSDIVHRAEGNAFFVEELTSAAAGPGRAVPDDLADALLVRLDRLDEQARLVVRTASASGRRVTHDMLESVSGLDSATLDAGLRGAVERNVLVADGDAFAFRHALLGEAVYDDLLPGERSRLHGRYAAALHEGAAQGSAAALARHARLANDLETALTAGIQAGHEASAVGGPDEAAAHYEQALELLADPRRPIGADVDVSKLVVSTAEALTASGRPERAAAVLADHLERVPDDAPRTWRPRLLTALANAVHIIDSELDAADLSAQAVALAPQGDSPLRARVLANHARVLATTDRWEEAQVAGMDALGLAERLDLSELASDAITTLSGLKRAGPKEGLREALQEAVGRAERSGALQAELRGRYFLGRSYADWGEFDASERWFASAVERAGRAGTPWAPYGFEARWQQGLVKVIRGDWDGALALTDVAEPNRPPIPAAMLDSVRLQVEQRRGGDVLAQAQAMRRLWPREGGVAIHTATLEMVAAARRHDAVAVLAVYDDVVAVLTRTWHEWFTARIRLAAVTVGGVAHAMARMSGAERAAVLVDVDRLRADGQVVLDRYADPSGHWGPEGRAWVRRLDAEALRAHWLSGVDAPPLEVLVESWRETVDLFEQYGHRHETASVRTTLSGILRASGDLAGAREVGDLARAAAHGLGARPLLEELEALGSDRAARASGPSGALTPRELEILSRVAEGRSNGEIARLLFISAKTVSVHVSNILAKLDASGRTEAAAIGRRRGLLD